MRYSPNLNIIIQVINKISDRLARDFGEIENLQNNQVTATKFANSCYERIKKDFIYEFGKARPDYNIEFTDGTKVTNNQNAEYCYIICPIDGLINLSRALPAFTNIVALQYNKNGKKEIIGLVINNVASNETFCCEKNSGAIVNSRRIRTSSRKKGDNIICAAPESYKSLSKIVNFFQWNNCLSLNIGYLASGRIDLCAIPKKDQLIWDITKLLVKEAGGLFSEKENLLIASNGNISI